MSGFKRLRYLIAFGAIVSFSFDSAFCQEIPAEKQSVIVFDIKLDQVFKNAKAYGADLNQLDAEMPMENIVEALKPSEFKRVNGSLSLPESPDDLMSIAMGQGLPLEFFVRVEFANADACRIMTENVEIRSNEVELDGKTYWTPEEGDTGVYGRRINDTTYEFGSKAYVVEANRNFLTPKLNEIWKTAPDEAIRIAMDLETPDNFIAEAIAAGSESGDAQVVAYLELIDNLKTVFISADLEADNLLTFVAQAKDAEQAEEVKSGLDSLLMLAQMGGQFAVGQLRKQAPDAGKVMGGVLDSLEATQENDVVKFEIRKPDGFANAVTQIVEMANSEVTSVSEMNDFRQAGLAIHNYFEVNKAFPFDVDEKPDLNNDLSWRVRILPFLEEQSMYDQMDLSKGPTATANANFANEMPTYFGNGGELANVVWVKSKVNGFRDITDGTSNTVMLIEYPKGEPWLENGGLTIDEGVELVMGLPDGEALNAVLYDGSVRRLTNEIAKETLSNLFDPTDGNIVEDF